MQVCRIPTLFGIPVTPPALYVTAFLEPEEMRKKSPFVTPLRVLVATLIAWYSGVMLLAFFGGFWVAAEIGRAGFNGRYLGRSGHADC